MIKHPTIKLQYDSNKWHEVSSIPHRTLQLFITNKCNLRCSGCFYAHQLGKEEMSFDQYRDIVKSYISIGIKRVTLLGGEPALHPDLPLMVRHNGAFGLKTTIYTNGYNLNKTSELLADVRVGVHGLYTSEKPISNIPKTDKPFTLVYMVRKDNSDKLLEATKYIEEKFPRVSNFYLSSIKDIAGTGDFWKDTPDTYSNEEYASVVQEFINSYSGALKQIHISTRGVFKTDQQDFSVCNTCRFYSVYPNSKMTMCPMDISRQIFNETPLTNRKCNKSSACVLQKIVLERND